MRTMLSVILMLGVTTTTRAEESGKAGGRRGEARANVRKAAAARKDVKWGSETSGSEGPG